MSGWYAGVDLGGTSIKVALADEAGAIIQTASVPTQSHDGPMGVIERIADVVETLCMGHGKAESGRLLGVGMGVPGLVDVATGTTKFLPNLPTQWRDVPVAEKLHARLACPVRLLNDVRTATLGELRFGHGKVDPRITFAFFSLGTGVGGGIVIDGQLRLGPLGAAGELGHQTIVPDGLRCGCGNRGCLETVASGPAISAEGVRLMRSGLAPTLYDLVEGNADRITTCEMATAASADTHVREAIETAAGHIGTAAANIVTSLHPQLIVLGGGVAEIGGLLIDNVRKTISQRVGMFPTTDVRVDRSRLGEDAGVVGAVALAMQPA